MTPTERAIAALPPHLRRFVVAQDYAAYTPRDQAVWRHVLRRLTTHLAGRAHPRYLAGLAATGIGLDAIPSLDEMNVKLARAGWSAVAVRGFIPPAPESPAEQAASQAHREPRAAEADHA